MDAHFHSYKARYEFLDLIYKSILNSQRMNNTNIFISLDNIIHTLHSPIITREFELIGEKDAAKQFVSNILNTVAHYRNWFSRQGISCRIFLYYTSSTTWYDNSIFVADYRSHYKDIMSYSNMKFSFMNHSIRNGIKLLTILIPYINGCYLIDSSFIEPAVIPSYISEIEPFNQTKFNLLITRDPYEFQYVTKGNWIVISPRGDETRNINSSNLMQYYADKNNIDISNIDNGIKTHVFPILYTRLYSIIGDKYRSIPKLKRIGWKTIFGYLEKVNSNLSTKEELEVSFYLAMKNKNLDKKELNRNFSMTDVDQMLFLKKSNENNMLKSSISSQLIDTPDFNQLGSYFNTEFRKYPVNLMKLTQTANNRLSNPCGI